MPFPSPTKLGEFAGAIWDEFAHLYAQIEGYLRKEHKADGSHAHIHADDVTVTKDDAIEATGEIHADGDEHTLGEFEFLGGDGNVGEFFRIGGATDGWKVGRGLASSPLTETYSWELYDLLTSTSLPVYEIGFYDTGGYYALIPRADDLVLGFKDGTSIDRIKYLAVQDGIYELGRAAAAGYWTAVTHSAGNFTGNGSMTWTVASGDQTTFAYTLVGKTMTVSCYIVTSTIGGTPDNTLQIAIPGGFTANRTMAVGCWVEDSAGFYSGFARVEAAGILIKIAKDDGSNFAASTDNAGVRLTISFEIQ